MKKLFLGFFLGFMGILLLSNPVAGEWTSNSSYRNDSYFVSIKIDDAYYADLDGDGFEDDIKIIMEADFSSFKDCRNIKYRMVLLIDLELPSGLTFHHEFYLVTYLDSITIEASLFNQALELGWYTADVAAATPLMQYHSTWSTDTMIFDPPGGVPGGNPTSLLIYY